MKIRNLVYFHDVRGDSPMTFTHLQVRTGYSFYHSTIHIDRLIERAKELNFKSLAITDENVLYGVIPFYKACKEAGIKPIIGMTTKIHLNPYGEQPVVLLAKDNIGYKQLNYLSTFTQLHKELITLDILIKNSDHLIGILPVITSELSNLLLQTNFDQADYFLSHFLKAFQENDFYLGITDHGEEAERKLHQPLLSFHQLSKVPVVALQDVRYLKAEDYDAYDCLVAMKEERRWSVDRITSKVKHRHLRSKEEMNQLFQSFWPEVLENTKKIAEKCNVSLSLHNQYMPSYPVPESQDTFTYLQELCEQGVIKKYGNWTEDIKRRLTYELDVINRMNFSDYFLIVADFVSFAKNKGIFVGPGRGSSAGSIVAYVLDITDVDPLEHNLIFERFLNPERTTMPDIDIDFSDHRRDEVIDYIREKYGDEHVAQIITFGTFGPRSVIRDLIKTIGIPEEDEQYIFRHIPSGANLPLKEYLLASKELLDYVKQSKQLTTLFSIGHKLEGLPKHRSIHAAGIVISDEKLIHHTPLTEGSGGSVLTQFAMDELEEIGLLKIDLLGLRNLSLIENIVKSIYYHTKIKLNPNKLPEEDKKTYKLLRRGQTNGIFQLESSGMKSVLKRLKPSSFNDIVAVNALYRPGPMEFIPNYIQRKHGKEKVVYPHPDLEPILKQTYGVLIYQEQIMQIAHKIAGFSLGEADLLRRGISAKKERILVEQKEKFISGCLKNGYNQAVAEQIFSWIMKFANYGFPKSHSTAYSKISYTLAYLKANYPAYFFAELLSSVMNDHARVNLYIQEAKSLGVEVLPPSINSSRGKYTVRDGKLQIGLLAIKGVNVQGVREIIRAREEGPFKSLFDFAMRISTDKVNRRMIENLILIGAFDELYPNRASLLATLDQALEQGELFKEFTEQGSLFEFELILENDYVKVDDFSQVHKLTTEKELIGMYVSSHPLKNYRSALQAKGYLSMFQILEEKPDKIVKSAGIIQSIKTIRTRKGELMAFVQFNDETGDIDSVVFPNVFRRVREGLREEQLVFFSGKTNIRRGEKQLIIDSITPFDEQLIQIKEQRKLFIKVVKSLNNVALEKISQVSREFSGDVPIYIYSELEKKTYKLSNRYNIEPNGRCLQLLRQVFGESHVILEKEK